MDKIKLLKAFLFLGVSILLFSLFLYAQNIINLLPKKNLPYKNNVPSNNLDQKQIEDIIENAILHFKDFIPEEDKNFKNTYPLRFYFVDSRNFYIEYKKDKEIRKILVFYDKENKKFKTKAYFIPSEDYWKIVWGEDEFFSSKKIVLEYDYNLAKWVIKNKF